MYAFLDRFNKEFVSTFTSCQKGCSSCCKMDVHLTALEATHIAQASKLTARDNPLTTGHESKCPFLSEKGTCSIYNYRPLLCRTYHVLTPPEMCNDLDAQVMQYGSQSANMGNHIYKTIAEWIYFQTYHCTGKLETKDIRDYFLIPAKISKDFFTITPAPFLLKKKPLTQCQRLVRLLFVTSSAGSIFFDEKLIKRTASF